MEKVFDISFNMPKTFILTKMLEPHFKGTFQSVQGINFKNAEVIEDFFRSVNFTTPRHIKKVLSKYEILKSFKLQSRVPGEFTNLIPDILNSRGGNVFDTVYCLYFIILHEFFPQEFKQIENYDEKLLKYATPVLETLTSSNKNLQLAASQINTYLKIKDVRNQSIKQILEGNESRSSSMEYTLIRFLIFFAHDHPKHLATVGNESSQQFINSFNDSNILSLFCKFLIKHEHDIMNVGKQSNYILWDLFSMVNYLL